MLRISGLSVSYAGLRALEDVSLEVNEGEFVTIVGPNGAGKTTLLKAISGSVRAAAGHLDFRGRDVTRLPSHQRAALGIAHVPEGRRVFPSLTVLENLELGSYRKAARGQRAAGLEAVLALFPVLGERRGQMAGSLSGGEQQMPASPARCARATSCAVTSSRTLGRCAWTSGWTTAAVRTCGARALPSRPGDCFTCAIRSRHWRPI